MGILSIVTLALLGVVGTGAYHVYEWLVRHKLDRRVAFVVIVMIGAAMLTPFLLPDSGMLQFAVWTVYMCFAGVGARRIYDIIQTIRKSFRVES